MMILMSVVHPGQERWCGVVLCNPWSLMAWSMVKTATNQKKRHVKTATRKQWQNS